MIKIGSALTHTIFNMPAQRDSWKKPSPQPSWWSSMSWLKIAASLLTGLTISLTLLGYGFDYGYLDVFGLRPQELQRTPLDFLMRSDQPLLLFLQFINKMQNKLLDRPWIPIWWISWKLVLILGVLSSGSAYLRGIRGRRVLQLATQAIQDSAWVQHIIKSPRYAKIRASSDTRDRLFGYGLPIASALLVMVALYAVALLMWLICSLAIVLVIALPVSPVKGAREKAIREVVHPLGCRPLREWGNVEPVTLARCVRIVRDGCEVARGRYIEQSSNRVWLLSKTPWRVMSVPLDRSVMEDTPNETISRNSPIGTSCERHSES
jgi:hypothetical protein